MSEHHPTDNTRTDAGFTLTELLVTLSLIAVLAGLSIPTWGAMARARAPKAAASAVMDCLERARSEAVTTRRDVWVLFRHGGGDAVRIVTRNGGTPAAQGSWSALPGGVVFNSGPGTLLSERPPAEIIVSAYNGKPPGQGILTGGVMFARSGGIRLPARGGNALLVGFDSAKGAPLPGIALSRGTGCAEMNTVP